MQAAKIQGLNAAIKNIRKISPDLLKEMNREIKILTKEMVQDAKGYAPRTVPAGLSNWGNTGGQWSAFNSSEVIRPAGRVAIVTPESIVPVSNKKMYHQIGGAAQGVTISEVKNVVWQLPRPQNTVRPQYTEGHCLRPGSAAAT